IFHRLEQSRGVEIIADPAQLASAWQKLLTQPELAKQLAANAEREFSNDQGATSAILHDITRVLGNSGGAQEKRTMFMMKTETPNNKTTIWFDPDVLATCPNDYFEADYWRKQNKSKGSATGRSTAFVIDGGEQGLLLRHYSRG